MTAHDEFLKELERIMDLYELGYLPVDDEYFAALYEHIRLEDELI